VLGFESGAMIASLLLGALILGVTLATQSGEEDALTPSTHVAFDMAFAILLGVAAVGFAIIGDAAAAGLLSAGAVSLVLLSSLTRYSRRPT